MQASSSGTHLIKTDCLVIGGGPAGTTFSSLMKKRGWDVTLLEKGNHPKFHIGESLLPMNLPILERLGVLEQVRSIGVPKLGADFTIANSNNGHNTFYFKDALGQSPEQAFEVRRSEFDQVLFENSKRAGVTVWEGMQVKHVGQTGGTSITVQASDTEGSTHSWEARFVVDASGRDTFLSTSRGWKTRNPRHASAAVYGHFRGVVRRPRDDQGNISVYWFEYGWIWMIPLRDDIMSIGAVCRPEFLKTRRGSLDEFLLGTLLGLAEIKERMVGAEAVLPAQATGNYSYLSKKMCGPGYLLLGDAYAFIDPVFSSGVYLAMDSAERGMRVAEAWLGGSQVAFRRACWRYRRDTNRGISTFTWFIYRFTTPAMRDLMANPRNILGVVQAVISMLAGDVFSNRIVHRRLMVFKTFYCFSWVRHWRESMAARKVSQASVRQVAKEQ